MRSTGSDGYIHRRPRRWIDERTDRGVDLGFRSSSHDVGPGLVEVCCEAVEIDAEGARLGLCGWRWRAVRTRRSSRDACLGGVGGERVAWCGWHVATGRAGVDRWSVVVDGSQRDPRRCGGWRLGCSDRSPVGMHPSTVTGELAANGGCDGYRPVAAHPRALKASRRPQTSKVEANPRLAAYVVDQLQRCGRLSRSRTVGRRVPRRCGDAGVARDDLSVALRPRPWCAA